MLANTTGLEQRLWSAAEEIRANSQLTSSEYSVPVLGLIFLRYADYEFAKAKEILIAQGTRDQTIGKTDYRARGVRFLPEVAWFSTLLNLAKRADIGNALNRAMMAVETENEDLTGVLPKTYDRLDREHLFSLLDVLAAVPMDIENGAFGKIYEYFLGKFAEIEWRGGESFTPTSLAKLIVEIVEPFHGRIYDPACGSGGMFVQSAAFLERNKKAVNELSIYGQERVAEIIRLCKMNLTVHGLSGDIGQGVTYYEDIHHSLSKFDFVMSNPPFNADLVDIEKLKNDPRFPFGLPKKNNANYLWIQVFYSTLNERGRAGFIMANIACDAKASELEIRKQLIEDRVVDVMISVGPNFFHTVKLPCTLWFLDRGKKSTKRKDQALFIDAWQVSRKNGRAHREFAPKQIEFIANIVRLYRDEAVTLEGGSAELLKQRFPEGKYVDVVGLCRVASISEIQAQGWSLNPSRYVGDAELPTDQSTQTVATSPGHHPRAFVSHSSQDRVFVEQFATDLRTNGIDAWYSGWEIKPGDPIRRKIEEGLAGCDHFIIVLSKESIRRPWVQSELDAATLRNIAGKVKKIIPVKIEDCGELPPTLNSLCWEDCSGQSYEKGLRRILDSIFDIDVRPPLGNPPDHKEFNFEEKR